MFWFAFSHILSHLADVLSFADKCNIPSQLTTGVIDLCLRWAQSASTDYDVLFGPVLTPRWVRDHKPVLSNKTLGHVLYAEVTTAEPEGKLIVCHNQCEAILDVHSGKENVRFMCTKCESVTFVPLIIPQQGRVLGYHGHQDALPSGTLQGDVEASRPQQREEVQTTPHPHQTL